MIKAIDMYAMVYFLMYIEASEEEISHTVCKGGQSFTVLLEDKKPYWRSLVYSDYKGHRPPPTNPELFGHILREVRKLRIPTLSHPGLEADDIAGLVSHVKRKNNISDPVTFVTPDSDWLQLVCDEHNIGWSKPSSYPKDIRHENWVKQKVFHSDSILINSPKDIATIKYYKGDHSDNIPGNYPIDLVSLRGQSWLNSLTASGYDIDELEKKVLSFFGW